MNDSGHSSTSDPMRKPPKKPKNLNLPPPEGCDNFLKTTPPADLDNPDDGGKPERKTQRSLSAVSEKDREMFEYIESLQKDLDSSSVEALITENTFDYIEKFYKLVERVLELKQQNFKLQKRIRDLENLKNQQGQTEAEEQQELEEKDEAISEALLESILQDIRNKEFLKEKKTCGVAAQHTPLKGNEATSSKKGAKVSKWTKVKAAFRWEKASNVEDSTGKSQDSGIHVPLNCEVARYLRVPSTSDEMGHSAGDSGAGISTPGTISSASSNDELRLELQQNDGFRSSDDENPQQYPKKSHHKYHRTPWAKMKNIINHPRSSLKKKHRLSAASDDIQIDVEFCSDNEDVFETDDTGNKSTNISLSPSPNVYSSVSSNSPSYCDIPPDVVERYQRALKEDFTKADLDPQSTRWARVRKAFLARDNDSHPKRKISTNQPSSLTRGRPTVEDEIQKNYKKLQKKLSLEFQEKISEWERMKQNSPGAPNSPTMFSFSEETRNPLYIRRMEEFQMQSPQDLRRHISVTREKDLPDDFKKKLQEWEKIKKRSTRSSTRNRKKLGEITKWKSLGGPRSSDHSPVFEYPAISDDFRKKLDEWKQIKAAGGPSAYAELKKKDKTPSPKLSRKSSQKQSKKRKEHHKELHWFEKELGKIEKEKQRLERERHKYIEREERLSKLRHSMLGNPQKKEILVHTQSGFHRFEGISRKFTQKLYEWEKSQGIAPEASTFALLSSSTLPKTAEPNDKILESQTSSSVSRSKSVDSIPNLARPVLSGQPSSLSLNDMDDLEKSLLDSKNSSLQDLDLDDTLDDTNPETDEPEAVLVEVEDYEEETTEPLHISCIEKHQLPVYQREEFKPLCESETIAVPKVRRSESAKAQINYDLMETVSKLLTELQVTEDEIRALAESKSFSEESNLKTFKFLNQLQNQSAQTLTDTVQSLEEANHSLTRSLIKENRNSDTMEAIHESSVYMRQQVGQMHDTITERLQGPYSYKDPVFEQIRKVRSKISELRRHLSQVCTAGDRTSINRKLSTKTPCEITQDNLENTTPEMERHFIKSEATVNMSVSTGAVKKRISRRQMTINQPDSDEEDQEKIPIKLHRKLTRTRSISEGDTPVTLLQPSGSYEDRTPSPEILTGSAVTLFVKTTRKLFTPIVEASLGKVSVGESESSSNTDSVVLEPKPNVLSTLPPLPPSPVPQRKVYRDVSPNIKMIIAKYNQNVDHSAGGSSDSNSPIAWRSPVSERRKREDLNLKPPQSTSVAPPVQVRPESLKVDITLAQTEVRMRKLQQAKEEFLKAPVSAPCFVTAREGQLEFPKRNRLSQISVESDSGCVMSALVKSASAGMINVEPDVYHRIDPEFRSEGYVSLPRQITSKSKPSKSSPFSSLANKFRKVKMRKGKDKDKKVVSTLCRQSLVVDINNAESENNNGGNSNGDVTKDSEDADNKSEVSESPSLIVKNVTWIRKSLFKR